MRKSAVLLFILLVVIMAISIPVFAYSPNTSTRESIKEFILNDKTDQNEYVIGKYVCRNFALDVIKNAGAKGIEAHLFTIHVVSNTNETHSIVVFPTANGDLYVDVTQADNWVVINFDTMEYKVYSMLNNKLVLSTYIDWYLRGE